MKIGNKVRALRIKKGLNQENMADLLQISQATYNKYERNIHQPNSEKLKSIAEKLHVEIEEIMDDISEKYIQNNSGNTAHDNSFSTYYSYPAKLEKLYEDKIELLEAKVKYLETEIERLKTK